MAARADLLHLAAVGLFVKRKMGKTIVLIAPSDLLQRLEGRGDRTRQAKAKRKLV